MGEPADAEAKKVEAVLVPEDGPECVENMPVLDKFALLLKTRFTSWGSSGYSIDSHIT